MPKRSNAFRASSQVNENSELFKKPEPGAQFQYERTTSIDHPSRSTRGSEVGLTISSRYRPFRDRKRSLDPGRLRRALQHSRVNDSSPFGLRRPSALKSDLTRGKVFSPFTSTPCPLTRIGPSKPVFHQTSDSPDQAYLDPRCSHVDNKPVYGPSAFGPTKVIWREIVEASANAP